MPLNSFNEIGIIPAIFAVISGVWGAVLNFVKRDTSCSSMKKKIAFFLFDMFVNMGITLLIFIGAIGYGLNELTAVAIAGFLGHQGVRSFYVMELIILEKLGAKETLKKLHEND